METLFIGQEKLKFAVLESTNSYLKNIIKNGNPAEGLTVLAEYQTSGRGQFGNSWEAEKGKNLLFSVLLKPAFLPPDRQFILNMSVCLAVVDSLNEISPGFLIKWPNDILYNQKKVAGILIESAISSGALENTVVGIGININQTQFEVENMRTSLKKITGNVVEPDFVLTKVLEKMEGRYLKLKRGNTSGLFREYYSVMFGMERELPVRIGDEITSIIPLAVEPGGELLAMHKGRKVRFRFKEVQFILN
ncbi:MAG TPA: biotin--[acetyl-CoA-carboxylase] ligase [Cryomorphaceae bacterium]|nr:biotin--[acetyl-CoA-carboxylase] ligase [Owenweeksia sp.]HAD96109.1 biotin--[acetyl-CoA-carboxylase] ligase [Cryomorphaceae bacterium]HCQ16386.1 biotin--[acetyl-CoA-carboxylase] ligase [Cryomorphaceae bacterium]|tara:strand:+ start:512 stop:1258 length:747 start_codon:yes stop_codon:yes gene_type:complete